MRLPIKRDITPGNLKKGMNHIMNPLKKVYCRVFQTGMRIAIPLLPYRTPKLMHSVDEIPALLKEQELSSVLLVTDTGIRGLGLTKHLEDILAENNIALSVYDKTVANPTTDNVSEALALYKENNCQALIGFGGGSSMDCAKAVGACIARPHKSLLKMKGILKIMRPLPPLIAIPTTAGTGSETTLAAVITDAATRGKYPINDFPLIPKYAVLDPEVTRSLPPFITASTGLDALTHAVEAYIGRSTTGKTRARAVKAVELIFRNLEAAYEDGNNMEARKEMLHASYLAGLAFTVSYVGYVHAVAHSLGGRYNIPHGLANAVLLPIVLRTYGECIHKKLHRLAIAAGLSDRSDSHEVGAEKFISAIEKLLDRFSLGRTLSGIQEEDIPSLAKHADKEGNPLYPVPVLMNAKELEQFYYAVMEKETEKAE